MGEEFGHSIDEVENLIKKHEAFEKAAAAQEERFHALERLTTFELKDMGRRQDEEQQRQQDIIEKQKAAEKERIARQSRDQTDTKSETGSLRETSSPPTPSMTRPPASSGPSSPSSPMSYGKAASRRSSTASERRHKSSTRSKSPFRSFRFKKTSKPPSTYSGSEENLRDLEAGDEELEGILVRKHEWESTTKKASNRSWEKICVVLKGHRIYFYKDQKSYRSHPEETFKSESPVDLLGGNAEVATDYVKREHVFRLRLANGGDYLFQATTAGEMTNWVTAINQAAEVDAGEGRSQTLPPGDKKDEPKRRSFFTL